MNFEHPIGQIIKGHEKRTKEKMKIANKHRQILNLIRNQNMQIKSKVDILLS